ncbi:hypothetical protein DZF91_13325 [Actinomadura logoneensis]|uniref:Uncharacterized protein n=1 Tax=Actinomadura logoneensis TaxID=2293572 RepID=A0A372JMB5_9ACTN|nr:hypothetical protein [Actinomadura logoneensis]RFU41155.1 hypothetical protein DZF91_13325 [Actinomadura logoneensis]
MQAGEAVVGMVSWQEELTRRQVESRQRIENLRRQLAEVQARLEAEEDWLLELEIAERMMNKVLGEAPQAAEPEPKSGKPPAAAAEAGPEAEAARRAVILVPPWEPEVEVSVLPRAYRDVLEVLADVDGAMRAGKVSLALGRGEAAVKDEGLRGKLKRLTERGWLAEGEPGMFTLVEGVRHQLTRPEAGAGTGSSS